MVLAIINHQESFKLIKLFLLNFARNYVTLLKTDRKYPVKPFEVKTLENRITVASNISFCCTELTGGLVHQIILVGVDVVADGGHHHAVVPARLELVETEAGVLHQDTPAVPVESLQLVVSYLNNAWCQLSALSTQQMSGELRNVQCRQSGPVICQPN